jgi:hypothetical protein
MTGSASSVANAGAGTVVTATATCTGNAVLIAGGAQVTTTGTVVYLRSSYPSTTGPNGVWTAIGVVGASALGGGKTMTVTAYAICGS